MTVSHIGNRAMSLYITDQELKALDLAPRKIGRKDALRLLAMALKESRLDGWEAAELEVFPGRDAVLLFARRKSGLPRHFRFSDFESLLAAAHLCPDALPSILCKHGDGYLLTVYPFEGDRPPAPLYEFGRELGQSVYLPAHLTEQGAVLIPAAALANLRMHFPL